MLNKVMLIGHLGADPEVRYMPSGDAVTNISLATNRKRKDQQTGELREETEWHRIVFFNMGNYKLAEIAGEYLKKGSKVYVEGRIQTRKWQDKNTGQDRYSTEIIAEQMQMLDSRTGGTGDFSQQGQGGYTAPQTNQNFQQQPAQQFNQPAQQFNRPVQQQPAQQFTPLPVQQPVNQGQQPPLQPPPVQQPTQSFNQPPPVQQQTPPAQSPASTSVNDDFDDDIPF